MTDADFAKIKAAFPAIRKWATWQHNPNLRGIHGLSHGFVVGVWCSDEGWRWNVTKLAPALDPQPLIAAYKKPQPLSRCLRSLRCALRRNAKALSDMAREA